MTVQGNVLGFPILSLVAYLPLMGAVLLLFVGRERIQAIRNLAFASSLASLAVSLLLPLNFDPSTAAVQFVERKSWIPSIGQARSTLRTEFVNKPRRLVKAESISTCRNPSWNTPTSPPTW